VRLRANEREREREVCTCHAPHCIRDNEVDTDRLVGHCRPWLAHQLTQLKGAVEGSAQVGELRVANGGQVAQLCLCSVLVEHGGGGHMNTLRGIPELMAHLNDRVS